MKEDNTRKEFYPSIFNDVLAPATQGPSSSNTVGPYRIATIARAILDGKPEYLKIEMSNGGGFFDTFYGMESDKAFLAGILGKDLIKFDIAKVYDAAKNEGLKYEFAFTDKIACQPTEMGVLTVKSAKETITLTGITMGGGEILICDINGEPCELKGIHPEVIKISGSDLQRHIPSVYPLKTIEGAVPPFTTSDGMLKYANERGIPLWQAAIDYERSLTGLSEQDVWKVAEDTLGLSYASIDAGYAEGIKFEGITVAKASIMSKKKNMNLIPMGASNQGALDALAVMEYSNSHGIIVCMPTGGASGIIPAAIRNTSKALGKARNDEIKALLVSGLLGVFYFPTHYHGALGCQAEVGVATSMAAGALASLLDDEPETAERAAVMAMQYIIGQVCDPVEGYAQIPCFIRNIASVPIAMTCANFAVLGLDTAVNLDGMAAAVMRVGEKLRGSRINDLGTCMSDYEANPCSTCVKHKKQEGVEK